MTPSHYRSVLIRWAKWALPNRAVLVWPLLDRSLPFPEPHWGADKMSWNAICRPSVHYPEQHFLLSLGWRLSFVSQLSAGQNSSACLLFLVCIYNAVATEAGSVSIHLSCYLGSGMGLAFSDHSQLLHSHVHAHCSWDRTHDLCTSVAVATARASILPVAFLFLFQPGDVCPHPRSLSQRINHELS